MGTAVLHGAVGYPSSVQGGVHVAVQLVPWNIVLYAEQTERRTQTAVLQHLMELKFVAIGGVHVAHSFVS